MMGLDITAYSKLSKVGSSVDEDEEDSYFRVWANPDFPGRADGLEDGALYAYADAEEVLSMGYGSYNQWREALAKLAGYPLTETASTFAGTSHSHAAACWNGATGPFSELINFADNEGTIGPVVSAKLLRDFTEWDERAKSVDLPFFYARYKAMKQGLEMAADGGALNFH